MAVSHPTVASIQLREVYTQLFWRPPPPTTLFTGRTILVVGANVGLGKEAAALFAKLDASKVIITARSVAKGEEAKVSILSTHPDLKQDVFEVWPMDLADYASVHEVAHRASTLERIDHVVLNASMADDKFELLNGHEACVTVNVVGIFLLTLLLLPTLRAQAELHDNIPTLTIVGSTFQLSSDFPERNASQIFAALDDPQNKNMGERYATTKRLQLLILRELAARTAQWRPRILLNIVSPGFNKTQLVRRATGLKALIFSVAHSIIGWDPSEGARTIAHATVAGHESHGVLLSESNLWNYGTGNWVLSQEGHDVQKKVWEELVDILEGIKPGVTKIVA